jgi:ribosomal protein S4
MKCAKLTQNQAVKFIEQGHIRVGPDNITDPAYLVTRWVFYIMKYQVSLTRTWISLKTYGGFRHMGRHVQIEEDGDEI